MKQLTSACQSELSDHCDSTAMDSDLSLEFLRVVEQAAIACAHTMGQGDRHKSDQAAVEAMRAGAGHACRSTARSSSAKASATRRRCCTSARRSAWRAPRAAGPARYPQVDIAVDPLEGTNLCATGAPNAIAVLAASERGGLLHAPDLYMEKLVVGPSSKDAVSLDAPVARQPEGDRPVPRPRRRGSGRHRARSAAPREADRRHPRDRRAHPADRRRRSVGGHRRRGRRHPACTR